MNKRWYVRWTDRNNYDLFLRFDTIDHAVEMAHIGTRDDDVRKAFVFYDSHERGRK